MRAGHELLSFFRISRFFFRKPFTDQLFDKVKFLAFFSSQETEVANLDESFGQHMLKIASEELEDIKGAHFEGLIIWSLVLKAHPIILDLENASV